MTEDLKNDFFNYIFAMPNEPDQYGNYCRYDILNNVFWAYDADEIGFSDFNKEVYPPGLHPKFPDGVIGIRADDNFWQVALIPYRFCELSMEYIAQILWPTLTNCDFYDDVIMTKDDLET